MTRCCPSESVLEFQLVGNNLSKVQISTTVSNGSHIGLISQINSFSDTTGIKAYSSGNSGVILEHVDAGDIALKTVKLGSGVGISVNQLDQFGDRLLTNSKTLSDGQHLVIGGNVQMKSTSDFTANYNGNNLNSTNSAFDMGFSSKSFDIENDHTDISFYANYKLDSGYADASNINVVSSASKYSLTLSDPVFGNLESSFVPQKADEFSTGVISSNLHKN